MTRLFNTFCYLLCFIFFISCQQQETNNTRSIPDFFNESKPKAEVLLFGTFHFKDAGLDQYKPKFTVDIMSKKRQAEVETILDALEKFNPTKIIIERKPDYQPKLDSLYQAYLRDDFQLKANEIYQIGFKLAKRLGHQTLIAGDESGRGFKKWKPGDNQIFEAKIKRIIEEENLAESIASSYDNQYKKLYKHLDSLKTVMTLKDYLILENSNSLLSRKNGSYLLGEIGVNDGKEYPFADELTGYWVNRNYRIFSNIRKSISSEKERVLVIFGSAHVGMIKPMVEASPEMKLVALEKVLNNHY